MTLSEKEKELIDFIVFNKKEIADSLKPKLKGCWYFHNHWNLQVRECSKEQLKDKLVIALRELLVEAHIASTLEVVTIVTLEFIYKITGKFFFKKENYE
jgi:hypothetical protein